MSGFFSKLFKNTIFDRKVTPPSPIWNPDFQMPEDRVIQLMRYYTDHEKDFVIFKNGTCVIVKDNLNDDKVIQQASEFISKVHYTDSRMDPLDMEDNHLLVRYHYPVYNLILSDVAEEHRDSITRDHMLGLRKGETLETDQGINLFDFRGMKALLARSYFFQDAADPIVTKIIRKRG